MPILVELSHEDVTNIDSVGLVTARSGIAIPDNQKIQLGAGKTCRFIMMVPQLH